jgi:hypothetical protein
MQLQGEYVYGIVGEPQHRKFSFPGIGNADVYTINHEQIAAVVSDTEFPEIDPTRKNVQAHTIVQETLLKEYNLLPMGFGMIATDEIEIRSLLEDNYDGLLSELNRLAGNVEVELKVFWEQEAIMNELQGENAKLTSLKAKINSASSPFAVQNLLSAAGKMVESIVSEWKSKYAEMVYTTLQKLSIENKVNNPVGIKNLLNVSFLIEKSRENEFKEQVYELDNKFQGKMNFKYVGPLPPYSFVSFRLEPAKC